MVDLFKLCRLYLIDNEVTSRVIVHTCNPHSTLGQQVNGEMTGKPSQESFVFVPLKVFQYYALSPLHIHTLIMLMWTIGSNHA